MSWAEVKKINSDLKEPLDKKITDLNSSLKTYMLSQINGTRSDIESVHEDLLNLTNGDIYTIKRDVASIKTNTDMSQINEKLTGIKTQTDNIKTQTDNIKTYYDSINGKVNNIQDGVNTNKSKVEGISVNVDDILAKILLYKDAYFTTILSHVSEIELLVKGGSDASGSVVKSVQRGNVTSSTEYGNTGATSKTITIGSVNLSKSVLFVTLYSQPSDYVVDTFRCWLSAATTITYTYARLGGSGSDKIFPSFSWQVIEFN